MDHEIVKREQRMKAHHNPQKKKKGKKKKKEKKMFWLSLALLALAGLSRGSVRTDDTEFKIYELDSLNLEKPPEREVNLPEGKRSPLHLNTTRENKC